MIVEYKGDSSIHGKINPLLHYLEQANDLQKWEYMGMKVELDPTVDFNSQNILVRWLDIKEEFNDKMLVHSLEEFKSNFKMIND